MKRFLTFLSVSSLLFYATSSLTSCISNYDGDKIRIAFITDDGDIDDRSFNQGTWEGVEDYFEGTDYVNGKDFKYFKPTSKAPSDYLNTIDDAVTWGAKAIVCPGFLFESPIYEAQDIYKDVKFLIEDGTPHPFNDFGNKYIGDNTLSVYFKEQESGFLAGYSAVYEGYKKLGFMGGMSVPAVKKFGAGFIAGIYYAAHELNLNDVVIDDSYYEYLGTFEPNVSLKSKAASWYKGGVDVIFTAAGGVGANVMSAAEEADKMMIGVDVDQSYMSKSVLTSAKKNLSKAVEIFLDRVFNGWKGGEELHLGSEIDGIGLPLEASNGIDPWRFNIFTKDQYYKIYSSIKSQKIIVPNDYKSLNAFVKALNFELKVTEATFDDKK